MKKVVGIAVALALAFATSLCGSVFAEEALWWRTDRQDAMPNENTARRLDRLNQSRCRAIEEEFISFDGDNYRLVIADPEVNAMAVCRVRVDYDDTDAFRKLEGQNGEAVVRFDKDVIEGLSYGVHPVRVDFMGGQYAELEIEIY